MPQTLDTDTAQRTRELFTSAIEPGEELKVRFGQKVVYNDSDVGKPQNRITPELFKQIEDLIAGDKGDRADVMLTDKGNPKAPAVEVVAVSGKGIEGERILLRQEPNFSISTNVLADQIRQQTSEAAEAEADAQTEPAPQPESSDSISPEDSRQMQPEVQSEATVAQPAPASNTAQAFAKSVEELPPSQTKALFQKIENQFSVWNRQREAIAQTRKEMGSSVAEAPKALLQDTKVLIQQGRQKLSSIQQNVQKKVSQTSLSDIASMAVQGTSKAVETGSEALGKASNYLKDRADHIKSYGMAKAAIAIYNKGQARTGESMFKVEGYTVEAVTDGYKVKDPKDRLIMSFGTDSKGKPISVTKETAIQPADYKAINQASRSKVIEGSPAAENTYRERIQNIVAGAKEWVSEGEKIDGNNFRVDRPSYQAIAISTQGFPRRGVSMDDEGQVTSSDLTMEDLDKLERSIEQSPQVATREPEKVGAGVEMG